MPVLARSLARAGEPYPVVPGEYHLSDLLTRPAAQIAAWHRGETKPEGIPPWLAKRGLRMEDAALDGLDPVWRQPTIRLAVDGGATIVGHPDYLEPLDEARRHAAQEWELGEAKSQQGHDDEVREDQGLNQGLGYVGLLHAGATVAFSKGHDEAFHPRRVAQVNVVLAGLHDAAEQVFPVDQGIAGTIAKYLTRKAATVHAAVGTGGAARLADFDRAHPPIVQAEYIPVPVAQGEEGVLADETVTWYMRWKDAEREYEERRARWMATLTLQDPKRRAPAGGSLGVVKKTEQVLNEEAWRAAGGPDLDEAAAKLRAALALTPAAVEAAAAAARAAELRRAHVTERAVPGYVKVYPPKGAKP